ncbi:hypothetical protein CDQ84_16225 [Clostridium thermosuccinogenes]|jgi:N-acetylglucosamine kinase-like BadF-type ATPase|uniref:ATPase BadF/BadG/BcrA/BcrD type domain-containing protein n=1 Tax=Clostridium thermosuccinogenes TaxID=84032 RepID=A0A2K2FAX1_9CLOT|nr:BadF/BadG/BcrA/BcrD ATPase family protein [Pseudoclostridium thermosuccinogenes]AUS95346.1 hypothetical protein CDO33_02155 [Pseudoclostridium thermosuccinogenes]PNT90595.1 hypothetical protein CDQ83_18275 [Pseudoclostridium thermosuccinogenes]PNT91876.1 hypothetical protein CDQ85_18490 [Pseudoclostridium thermosuccinogenes]PNT95907.1 hypothetical protein CDQ84_16225 [Pseudoclostridium thermosuccinogenes]
MAILAIDQGASKTSVLVASLDGRILGEGKSEGACYFTVGLERAKSAIMTAAFQALAQAGLTINDISIVIGGLAGANWPDEIEMLQNEMKSLFKLEKAWVWNDSVIALRAGTDSDCGIVLCCGSGMNCAVVIGGKLHAVYNNYIDSVDQGGEGFGHRVLKAVFQSHIKIKGPTSLTKRVMEFFGYDDMDAMLLAYQRGHLTRRLKDISVLLFDEAKHNDREALEIIYSYGKSISRYVTSAIKRYDIDTKKCEVILSGGLFKIDNPLLAETVCSHIHRVYSDVKIKQAKYEPVVGAVLMGLDMIEAKDGKAHELCKEEAEKWGLTRFGRG